ncbi:hypothetical protein [Phyllobacterium leguminum]|uniref:Uncharacterized protein n=1 Tax=Phyllobacterium leguminum TaxID=314237 RepID=A0A318T9K7_9HYPH|nr:hypothetical protein [Phyllobacterium leguminum]PYE89569.1 hypothetical protein C7477_10377 [Phyllobacterium leguminum]
MENQESPLRIEVEAVANEALATVEHLKQRNLILASELIRTRRIAEVLRAENEQLKAGLPDDDGGEE